MSQAGIVDVEGSHPQIPTSFVTNVGTAVPLANVLEILATTVAAHSIPVETTGSGNTVTVVAQYASATGATTTTAAGFASFNSAQFTVDANGWVSSTCGSVMVSTGVDASTVKLYYKTNTTTLDGSIYTNGTLQTGFSSLNYASNLSNNFT
jgi:hypothetical protein